jgi:CheY-like chemotaxis protein
MAEASVSLKTVVIADDTPFVRDRFVTALESGGHRAVAVKSGGELLARVRDDSAAIDLIVLDLRLPPAPGVDLVRSLRALTGGRLPVLIFSGTIADAEEVRELASLGVAGYLDEYSAIQHILPSLAPHLFPDSLSRRGSPRVILGMPVQYRFGHTLAAALTLDLSHGGMAILTAAALENGSLLSVRFRLPGSTRDIEAEGRVAWNDGRGALGLEFEKVEAPSQALINTFVDAHFFSKREPLLPHDTSGIG